MEKDVMSVYAKIPVGIFILLLTLGMFGPLGSVALAATTTQLYVSPASYGASALGQTVPIQVIAYLVFNLNGFQFQLKFNATLLQCLNATLGSFFPAAPNSATTITIDNSAGTISIQSYIQGSGTPVSGFGPLLNVNFKTIYATTYPKPQDTCPLAIAGDTLYGTGNQPIAHVVGNGTYTAPYAPLTLGLTLNSNKNNYFFDGDKININGTLTGNGSPIATGLVALEILNGAGGLEAARTLPTSSGPFSLPLQIMAVSPCDLTGTPQSSFQVNGFAYFKVTVWNSLPTSVYGLVICNPYDSSNASLGVALFGMTIPATTNNTLILSLPLPYDPNPLFLTPAASGTATVYVSVWTDLVENGGTPLALERQAIFTITGSSPGQSTLVSAPPVGTFQTSVAIHFVEGSYSSGQPAIYRIMVGATFLGSSVTQSKQIAMILAGDIKMEGKVNLADLVLLAHAYGSKPGDAKWNPNADVDGNGVVGLSDLVLLADNYGKGTA